VDGWVGVKTVLGIAYSNQKVKKVNAIKLEIK
jgi:hypothetical protein